MGKNTRVCLLFVYKLDLLVLLNKAVCSLCRETYTFVSKSF